MKDGRVRDASLKSFGMAVKEARLERGFLTLQEFGEVLGVTPQMVWYIEKGQKLPGRRLRGLIKQELGLSYDCPVCGSLHHNPYKVFLSWVPKTPEKAALFVTDALKQKDWSGFYKTKNGRLSLNGVPLVEMCAYNMDEEELDRFVELLDREVFAVNLGTVFAKDVLEITLTNPVVQHDTVTFLLQFSKSL